MSSRPPAKSLNDLLARLADGELSEPEAVALEILLQESPENREHYRLFVEVHLALGTLCETAGTLPFPETTRRSAIRRWHGAAAAAVLIGALAVWQPWQPATKPADAAAAARTADRPVLAVIASAEGVAWDLPGAPKAGTVLAAGPVNLAKGELLATLVNGQTLALRGPAMINLVSEREVVLMAGELGVRQKSGQGVFVVRLPQGAAVCPAGEFVVRVRDDGVASLLVFEGTARVSTIERTGQTREEAVVGKNGSLDIGERLEPCSLTASAFARVPRPLPTRASPADAGYAKAVAADAPVAFWRFEETDAARQVPATHGNQPLELRENATLAGPPGRRFLAVDDSRRRGFAYSNDPVATFARDGFTVECLIFSASERYGTAIALESATLEIPAETPELHHAPQLGVIERMGRMGEIIGHIHPDYALRSMLRFPGGYKGGINMYSSKSHLLHQWHHAAVTYDGSLMRLYLDGELTDETPGAFAWEEDTVRVVVGRLQPVPQDEHRQWIGGLDEIAIYPRALPAAAIARHYQALGAR